MDALLSIAPRLSSAADLRSFSLTAQEGFLLSQIDGVTPACVLCDVVAMDAATLARHLQRLESLGVITWSGQAGGSHAGGQRQEPDRPATRSSDTVLAEACDLSVDEKRRILQTEQGLSRQSHWELLGLTGDPSAADIKRAYFAASKAYHPDRYFGRDIGSYRGRLEKIFHALKTAYDVLRDDATRKAYAAKRPPPRASAGAGQGSAPSEAEETPEQKRERLEKRRQEIIAERRARRWGTPFGNKAAVPAEEHKTEEPDRRRGPGQGGRPC